MRAAPDFPLHDLDTRLATRDQLVAAFGPHTGLHQSWFSNLADAPGLLRARKQEGRSSSGKKQAWFCPVEVMHWLVHSRRKRGRPLDEDTGWRLLALHFSWAPAGQALPPPGSPLQPPPTRGGERIPLSR